MTFIYALLIAIGIGVISIFISNSWLSGWIFGVLSTAVVTYFLEKF